MGVGTLSGYVFLYHFSDNFHSVFSPPTSNLNQERSVVSLDISHDEELLLIANSNFQLLLYDIKSNQFLKALSLSKENVPLRATRFYHKSGKSLQKSKVSF